ncbi:DVU0524 family FlgM-associated protein [Desulfovibrio legallii]|uniref:Uncharacterized protein n=1 Tax=Desulfovibrio legallii TaxID=571438 RepID=A0A6H3FAE5_9BACT|nr:DVU0524 family FlgM-associated protein [Desulfovibrio legallii]RHH24833.1 hypothetical protein DW219_03275 [Desulfovibrio sp. AM18-2]TBH80723.1 hypothetical protein EB812_03840 [Desulfovibrio legallii]CAI3238500.1 hypothetical protein DWUX_1943 [Desulfovibrio diazotrophicus]
MPDTTTARLRIMLQGYEQQLLAARRLARFRVRRRLAAGEDPREPDPLPKRHATVEQVARELYDMLLYTGSDNPVVEDIRQELSQELGREVHFTYPPDGSLCILGQGPDGTGALTPEQQRAARHALWRITRRRVDKGVLRPAPGFCPGHSGAE